MNISSAFNSTGEVGLWINQSTNYFTGSEVLTLLVLLGFLLLTAFILKLPLILTLLILFPLLLVLGVINIGFGALIAIAVIYIGIALFSNWFIK